jgi:hypothetical protein
MNLADDCRLLQVRRFRVLHGGNFILSAMACQHLFWAWFENVLEGCYGLL